MNTRYAHIPEIKNGVVFSGSHFAENTEGQYSKNFSDRNWLLRLNTFSDGQILGFDLYVGRPTSVGATLIKETGDGNYRIDFPLRYNAEAVAINCDSKAFCGVQERWEPDNKGSVIDTGLTGELGMLYVFTCKGEQNPAGFLFTGVVSEEFVNEDMLFSHLISSFGGMGISQELFGKKASPDSLDAMMLFAEEMKHAENFLRAESHEPVKNGPER